MILKPSSFFLATVATVLLSSLLLFQGGASTAQDSTTFDSPFPTPLAPPTPTPPSPSAEAQRALKHVSDREAIPPDGLLVVGENERNFPLTGRIFRAITILDIRTTDGREYNVLVDLADGYIEQDVDALEAAEAAAYQAKYGKLHPSLYERLQEVGDDDLLPVALWIAPSAKSRTRQQVYAELTTRYPEATTAMERDGFPWTVDDCTLAEEIRQEYRRMRAKDTAIRMGPLVDHLGERGFAVRTYGAMPSITAFLPKKIIVQLANRNDVGLVYLIKEQGASLMDTAAATDRVPVVWQRGFDGSGVDIAILEAGNIGDIDCLEIIAELEAPAAQDSGHKPVVASVAACDDDTYTGVAHGAQIIDAGFDRGDWPGGGSQENAVAALEWAVQDQSAHVVNVSYRWEYDEDLNWTDRAFDYWAREENVVIVSAAGNNGNSGGSLASPAKGWNVISVGASSDDQTSAWSDDTMWSGSSYVDPDSANNDREKPEVVAPGFWIKAIGVIDRVIMGHVEPPSVYHP